MPDKIEKSYREINSFLRAGREWLQKHPEQTKFRYALKRVVDRGERAMEGYRAAIEDLNVKYCAVDDKKCMMTDERGQFKYEPDRYIERSQEQRKVFDEVVEIEPYYATELVPLSEEELDAFEGYVFKEEDRPEPAAPVAASPPPNASA